MSGSLNPELELTPAQRRKALAGSIVELSGEAKLGRGEKSVRDKERNRASKRVREGLLQKQKERREQELAEVRPILRKVTHFILIIFFSRRRMSGIIIPHSSNYLNPPRVSTGKKESEA